MDQPLMNVQVWLVAAGLFGGLVAVAELFFHFGRRSEKWRSEDLQHLGTIEGAILGLLALLLGFSFASASNRYYERSNCLVDEAAAIEAVWRNADLLPESQRDTVRMAIREYLAACISLSETADPAVATRKVAETLAQLDTFSALLHRALLESPPLLTVMAPALDRMATQFHKRVASRESQLPGPLLTVLVLAAFVAVGTVGYAGGMAGRRTFWLTSALAFLIAAVLAVIVDMDHPLAGIITTTPGQLIDLLQRIAGDTSR